MKNDKLNDYILSDEELKQPTIDDFDWELMKESDPNLSEQ